MKILFITTLIISTVFISQYSFAQKSITAHPINVSPVIDGTFEPEKWLQADTASQFIQMEPQAGEAASEKTIGYIGNTRIKTFYSRRIQDIDYGARLIGKVGKAQFNILNVKSPEMAEDKPSYYLTAARVKYDFLKSSSVGATLVDKSWNNGFTRSFSLDYIMNFSKTWQATGQFVGSSPGDFWNHSAGYFRIARENSVYHYHIRYTQIGEKFRETVNQTGFVPDDNRKKIDSDVTYKWWQKDNALKYIDMQSMNIIFWSIAGTLRSWYITDLVNFYFNNRLNIKYSYNNEYKLYEKEYYNHAHKINLGYNTDEWNHAQLGFTTGKNYDRDFTLFSGEGSIKLFKKTLSKLLT